MGIKLIELERALIADEYIKTVCPNMTRKERSIITLRLEYFDRMGVRLHYQARDMMKRSAALEERKRFCELSCDILALASLIHPYHRAEIEPEEKQVWWAIERLFALYNAAEALLNGDNADPAAIVQRIKDEAKPEGWGSTYSHRFDKHIKGLMDAAA